MSFLKTEDMKTVYVIDKNTMKASEVFNVTIEEPFDIVFCKDRQTKKRYIMVRTKNADFYDLSARQLFETKYSQYDNITIEVR